MKLHRTPVHHQVLGMVRDRWVRWRDTAPGVAGVPRRSAGFVHSTGKPLEHEVLVALYELRRVDLITVDGGVVLLSADGRARLAEWDATRAVNR